MNALSVLCLHDPTDKFHRTRQYLPWVLHHPFLFDSIGRIDVRPLAGLDSPEYQKSLLDTSSDFSKKKDKTPFVIPPGLDWDAYDLVVIGCRHGITPEAGLARYLASGKPAFLTAPEVRDPAVAEYLTGKKITLTDGPWERLPYAVRTEHPATAILGLPPWFPAYSHDPYGDFLRVSATADDVEVLTTLGQQGPPDWIVQGNLALTASDVFAMQEMNHRTNMQYDRERRNLRELLMNTLRHITGRPWIIQPSQKTLESWNERFYAVAMGKEYVSQVQRGEKAQQRLPAEALAHLLAGIDDLLKQAAVAMQGWDYGGAEKLWKECLQRLAGAMDTMTPVQRYLNFGWHSTLTLDRNYGGGLLGMAEGAWVDLLLDWCARDVARTRAAGGRRMLNIMPNDLESIERDNPRALDDLRRAIQDGVLELSHGTFTSAWAHLISPESAYQQLAQGLATMQRVMGSTVFCYMTPSDHYDLHPQLPQLLAGFGVGHAILGRGGLGKVRDVNHHRIHWRGIDGTTIDAVPQIENVNVFSYAWAGYFPPDTFEKAENVGVGHVYSGVHYDATHSFPGEPEMLWLNSVAPVVGQWTSNVDFFRQTPAPPVSQTHYLDADGLHADCLDMWSGWGCMNEASGANRQSERTLAVASYVAACHSLQGTQTPAVRAALRHAWVRLMQTQDHILFGSVDYDHYPPQAADPAQERTSHARGYQQPPQPANEVAYGAMDNFSETGSTNFAGPRVPQGRYVLVRTLHQECHDSALAALDTLGKATPALANPSHRPVRTVVELDGAVTGGQKLASGKCAVEVALDGLAAMPLAELQAATSEGGAAVVKGHTLENGVIAVKVDSTSGALLEIRDVRQNRVVLSHPTGARVIATSGEVITWKSARGIENGPVRAVLELAGDIGGLPAVLRYTLDRGSALVEMHLAVDHGSGHDFGPVRKNGQQDNTKGLLLVVPFAHTRCEINQPFAIYPTQKPIQVTRDMAFLTGAHGTLGVYQRSTPAFTRSDNEVRFILAQGTPNVTRWQTYPFALDAGAADACVALARAQDWNQGPVVMNLPAVPGAVSVSGQGVHLSGMQPVEGGMMLRIYAIGDTVREATITVPAGTQAFTTRLDGSQRTAVAVVNGQIRLTLGPWKIASLYLTR